MTKLHTNKLTSRRAVAPVIATLLLVAIAVVGGSIIFVFSQGFFSSAQVSGSPQIESIKILGYDATDGPSVQFHDGYETLDASLISGGAGSDGLLAGEYIAVYLKNDSVNKVTFSEIRLAGDIYTYVDEAGAALSPFATGLIGTPIDEFSYTIVRTGDTGLLIGETIDSSSPELEPGQQATMVIELENDVKSGRDMQYKLTTTAGAVFVGTINSGQQSG